MYTKQILHLGTIVLLLSAVGCASNSSVRRVEGEALAAQKTADTAITNADAALATAREAKQIAAESNGRSIKTEETVTRSFKKSMYK